MREYDDNIHHYAPMLRWIIILVAVITAVPVVLWTITAFMRTYIAQPTIPAPRPLAAVTAPAPSATVTADATGTNPPASPQLTLALVEARAAAADAGKADIDAKGDRMRDDAGNATTPAAPPATVAAAQPAPAFAPAPIPPPAANVLPNPLPMPEPQPVQAPAAVDTAEDDLPPPDPITGAVPLPRHRPAVFAFVLADVPLPRARPSAAPEPTGATVEPPPAGYDPGIGH